MASKFEEAQRVGPTMKREQLLTAYINAAEQWDAWAIEARELKARLVEAIELLEEYRYAREREGLCTQEVDDWLDKAKSLK